MSVKRKPLPAELTIVRFCKARFFSNGRLQPTAFHLRQENGQREEYLSVNCLEVLASDQTKALQKYKELCLKKKLEIKPKTGVAILNVGSVIRTVEESIKTQLSILCGLKCDEPSYSGIFNYPEDQDIIAEIILELVDLRCFKAGELESEAASRCC